MSSLGKGIAAASLGALLQARGYTIRMKKLDPYININPGTLSPHKHGEVFVMKDGCEADLDFGHYERFTGITCSESDSLTTGKVYNKVRIKEQSGEYFGSDIQVIPHITNEIKNFIIKGSEDVDFTICEIGGTIGDIEGLPYIESLRQLSIELGKHKSICIHLTFLPYIKTAGELKTKPTQHSVKQLQSMGVQPDILLCRTERDINNDIKNKLAMFCNVKSKNVISALDADNIYLIPEQYHNAGQDKQVCEHFGLISETAEKTASKMIQSRWGTIKNSINFPEKTTKIAIIGNYQEFKDAYLSLSQAVLHAGIANKVKVDILLINPEDDLDKNLHHISTTSGIIVPEDVSMNNNENMFSIIKYARENKKPFLGIGLGFKLTIEEYCKNVLDIKDLPPLMKDESKNHKGNYDCHVNPNTLTYNIYKSDNITERHKNIYVIDSNIYNTIKENQNIIFSCFSVDKRPESIELKDHPFFIATQFFPEFQSTPFAAHPLFCALIKATL